MSDKAESTRSVAQSLTVTERVARPVVYRLPDMDRVRVISNLKYSEVDNPYLLMDVYLPPELELHERRQTRSRFKQTEIAWASVPGRRAASC